MKTISLDPLPLREDPKPRSDPATKWPSPAPIVGSAGVVHAARTTLSLDRDPFERIDSQDQYLWAGPAIPDQPKSETFDP